MQSNLTLIKMTILALWLVSAFPVSSNASVRKGRKPIYIHRTLHWKSKFLFWDRTKTVDFLLVIYDKYQRGRIDSYKWWENGKLLHKGECFSYKDPDSLEYLLTVKAKNWTELSIDENEDEYLIPFYSKDNKSKLGSFTINHDFSDAMEFESWRPDFRGEIIISITPPAVPASDRFDYIFKVKTDNPKKGEKPFKTHHILVTDNDLDGICDSYSYEIGYNTNCLGPFKSSINIWNTVWKFQNIVLQNQENIYERQSDRRRISVVSKLDGKSIGYLEIYVSGEKFEYPMIYIEYPNVDNRYATLAEKFGLFYPNFPYKDYANFLEYEPFFWNANIQTYKDNLFVQLYKFS